jgi:outer membrane protein
MKKFFRLVLLAAFIVGISANAFAASGTIKIGYLDTNAVALQSNWGKKIIDDLKKEQERLASELDEKGKAFKAAKDEFDKKREVMDEKAKSKKQKELQDMATELEKLASDSSAKFNQLATQAKKPLFDKITEIVSRIARDDKYDFIFEKASLHYASDKDDLTKRIAGELDKSSPK